MSFDEPRPSQGKLGRINWTEKETLLLAKIYRELWIHNVALGKKDKFFSDRSRCLTIRQKLLQENIDRTIEQIHTKINNLKSSFYKVREMETRPGILRSDVDKIMSPILCDLLAEPFGDKDYNKHSMTTSILKQLASTNISHGLIAHDGHIHHRTNLRGDVSPIASAQHSSLEEGPLLVDHGHMKKRKHTTPLQTSIQDTTQNSDLEDNEDYGHPMPIHYLQAPLEETLGMAGSSPEEDRDVLDIETQNSSHTHTAGQQKRRRTEKLLQHIYEMTRVFNSAQIKLVASIDKLTKAVMTIRETQDRQHQELLTNLQYSNQQLTSQYEFVNSALNRVQQDTERLTESLTSSLNKFVQ